jgi:ankyrin repeat protein
LGGLIYVIYIDCKPSGFFWKAMGTCACTVMFTSLLSMTPVFAADVDERLWSAASHADLEGLKAAIEDAPDVDYANRSNMPTLQVVAMNGNASVVGLLLKRGANSNIVDKYGDTPLITALRHRKKTVIDVLIANGADVHRAGSYG